MKQTRHEKILQIIRTSNVSTQDQLLDELKKVGFDVTQATISRDIKKLGLVKIMTDDGQYKYHFPGLDLKAGNGERNISLFKNAVISVDYAMNTVVIKCNVGMANGACAAFDSMNWDSVVGTIAGDDTVFVLLRTPGKAQALVAQLNKLLNE